MVSLRLKKYFPKNRTTEGGESKIIKTSLRTEPPKVVSLKFAKPPKVVSLKLKFL